MSIEELEELASVEQVLGDYVPDVGISPCEADVHPTFGTPTSFEQFAIPLRRLREFVRPTSADSLLKSGQAACGESLENGIANARTFCFASIF